VRYEVTPNDTPDSIMALMIDNAFDAGQVKEKSFDGMAELSLELKRAIVKMVL